MAGLLAFLDLRISGTAAALWWPGGDPVWTTSSVPEGLLGGPGPWRAALDGCQALLIDVVAGGGPGSQLPAPLAEEAARAGFAACWCLPVCEKPCDGGEPAQAVLVVWSRHQPRPLFGHTFNLELVGNMVRFAMAREQLERDRQAQLERERAERERLALVDAMRTDLIQSVSHDLRTPLTSILSAAQLLTSDGPGLDEEDRAACAEIVARNAGRMLRLVEDLIFLAQLDEGERPERIRPVDLPQVAEDAVALVRPLAEAKGLDLELGFRPGDPIRGDPDRISRLMENLLSNAVKYTPSAGQVRLEVGPSAGGWEVRVSDTGIGIPPDERDRIFDRFARASNAHQAGSEGSGLGLVIAQAVAAQHGGSVRVESELGEGSVFVALLRDVVPS